MQKKWIIALAAAVGAILLLGVTALILSAVSLGQSRAAGNQNTLTVYGQARVSVTPDIAYITLGYENSANSPQLAQQKNAAAMDQIKAAVREVGVEEADIVDAQYNIYQEYYYSDLPEDQSYRVSNVISITARDVNKTADIIAAACKAGANISYGITYDLVDRKQAYGQALEMARGRADEKAAELAESLGRSIKGIEAVTENAAVSGDGWGMDGSGTALADFVGTGAGGAMQISAVVTVTYRLD